MVETVRAVLGPVTILVNNAAIRSSRPFRDLSVEEWRRVVGTSLDGSFHCTRAVVGGMVDAGFGRIVSLSGVDAHDGHPGTAHVAAAKAGIEGMTRVIARELGEHGITANVISPGPIATSRPHDARREQAVQAACAATAVRRVGTPDELARVCVFLCLPESGFITGQVIHVNGGLFLGR
jgi:NAD(P)-dependent dehydrogenase (short-subunit alcohol dehydrogenase family)